MNWWNLPQSILLLNPKAHQAHSYTTWCDIVIHNEFWLKTLRITRQELHVPLNQLILPIFCMIWLSHWHCQGQFNCIIKSKRQHSVYGCSRGLWRKWLAWITCPYQQKGYSDLRIYGKRFRLINNCKISVTGFQNCKQCMYIQHIK